MSNSVLVDLTKCIGCGSCTVACKMVNQNKWIEDIAPTSGEAATLADENWTVIKTFTPEKNNNKVLRYVKIQCLHCKDPICASSCRFKAFEKKDTSAVICEPTLCIGCKLCAKKCPFNIPHISNKFAYKCTMCHTRIEKGEIPACISICPTEAMKFGSREEILDEAKKIISSDERYINHIYGETEIGGTDWIYISDIPFEELGFKTNFEQPKIIPKKVQS